ncbi:VWA domain-containing protein [Blastopirellula sp. JC732]|uniref:VWA domain-containing protein n=1 Tax=Blastopirellula sediminis TaxID=2894196 RepID=A0A9X1SF28_9BACT|nr:vWA domain-containing protein [Blastopirellula sediminis]MCC9608608.1 VWA domain-containing protein [Blastopirellula sediminis]MCC9628615.1 VWA domain-containing protein [Blastopirellula sediminis]
MGLFDRLFGWGDSTPKKRQLPSNLVAEEFGEINICVGRELAEVDFTILMEPTGSASEGWQTGMAIDASASMSHVFGRGLEEGPRKWPDQALMMEYQKKGWLQVIEHQGQHYPIFSDEAQEDLVRRGNCVWSKNIVEPIIRRVTAYLASELDADGGTTCLYWACGDGGGLEEIGDLTAADCETASFKGPQRIKMGQGTRLAPALRYFEERFRDAKMGIYIFITDGALHDLEEVKQETIKICRQVKAGKRNFMKCVLIGIGDDINVEQMEELDDLDSGTDVDIWDHKIAREMRTMMDIFAELVSENQIVAPHGRIFDSFGNVVKSYSDGLPAKVAFTMPANSTFFELEAGGKRIKQTIEFPKK